ncbi:XkdQ/YqbQ family protein [Paenibacillus sp. KN14-4R]|uniref:XkdQ/YqbQ family protein n=1 Tax=Paenibacillus sp. KN14-4R TaxID=3445773 RepID=UPI003FA0680D
MLEVLIDNKDGQVWDISNIVSRVSWKTKRIGAVGSLDVTMIKGGLYEYASFKCNNGDIIKVRLGDANIFYGYIFSIDSGKDEAITIKAYDQLRYLMVNDTYVLKGATATEVIKKIADDFKLKTGTLVDTQYKIPSLVEDNKKLLDIISKALDLTIIATNKNFVLYDDFGSLALRNVEDLKLEFYVGDGSLMYDYTYNRSIDEDTYNKVKIIKDNKKSGKREVYIEQDSANIAKWGLLQLYQSVDENMNAAQISDMLQKLITVKNREKKTIQLKAIGDPRVRAGCYVPVEIKEFGINQHFLIDECTHDFDSTSHTMTLSLKVI